MSVQTSVAARIVGVNAMLWLCNNGWLLVYDGKMPGSVEAPAGGALLVKAKLPTRAFSGAEAKGADVQATASDIEDAVILSTGTASWFRFTEKDGHAGVWQGKCGVGADATMRWKQTSPAHNPCDLIAGMKLVFDAVTFTLPKGP